MHAFEKHLVDKGLIVVSEGGGADVIAIPGELLDLIYNRRRVLVPWLASAAIYLRRHRDCQDGRFVFDVKAEDIETMRNLLERLHTAGFIRRYEAPPCNVDTRFVVAMPVDAAAQRFFRSAWAEACFRRLAKAAVQHYLRRIGPTIPCRILSNVKIARKEDAAHVLTELDLVLEVGDWFYVVEVKSGPWIRILQWAQREHLFAGPRSRVVVCTSHPGIPSDIFLPQILLTLESFESGLTRLLECDLGHKLPKTLEMERCWQEREAPRRSFEEEWEELRPFVTLDTRTLAQRLDEDVFHIGRGCADSGGCLVRGADGGWYDDYDLNAYLD